MPHLDTALPLRHPWLTTMTLATLLASTHLGLAAGRQAGTAPAPASTASTGTASTGTASTGTASTSTASRIAKYATGVDNMEKTVAFYKNALGIGLRPGTSLGAPTPLTDQLQSFANVPAGAKFRSAFLTIPGAIGGFDYELTEFTGPPRPARKPRFQDPGASVLLLNVNNLAGVLAGVRQAGGTVVSAGDGIVSSGGSRGSLVQDPDGAFVALFQNSAGAPAGGSGAPAVSEARFGYVVADAEKAAAFYVDRLGLTRWSPDDRTQAWADAPQLAALAGLKTGRRASVIVRSSTTPMDFFDFAGAGGTAFTRGTEDPGVPVIGLEVKSAAAAAAAITAGGGTIVSGGGKGVPGMNLLFARDPAGVLVEVIQTR